MRSLAAWRPATLLAAWTVEEMSRAQHDWVSHDLLFREQTRAPLIVELPGDESGERRSELSRRIWDTDVPVRRAS